MEICGSTTKLVEALKNVNKDIKNTQTELKSLEKLLKLDPSNTELLSQKQKALAEAIGSTKDKLDTLKATQEQAKQQLENGTLGKDKYNALQQEIIRTEQELKKLAEESARTNTALKKIGDIGNTLTSLGGQLTSVGKTLTTHLTAPIAALGTLAVKTGMDFDASMSEVKAISGATGEDFDRLRDKAREMGATTKFSANEAAQAMKYMSMAGWRTEEMLDGIEGIMALAAASGEDLATTSDIVTDALSAFGLTAKDSAHFSDILAAASNNANTNVSLLGESFRYIATSAGTFKFSAEDTAVALGLMANAGIKGTQAGTSLKNALVNLTKPTKQQVAAMQQLGLITTEYVTKVDSDKVAKAQSNVEKATLALETAQAKYSKLLREQGANSTQAIAAHGNVEKAQIKLNDATRALSVAQENYNKAVREHGANSKEAKAAHDKLEQAQSKVRTATINLNTAQEKYNKAVKDNNADSPQAIAARNAVEQASLRLKNAQDALTKAQQGTTKAVVGQNLLMSDANGNVRSLDEIIRVLRTALGETNVELVDSEGNLKDFDTVLKEAAEHGASLTQIQKLQAAATIFGKQNMSGMLAIINASQNDYDKLSNAVRNCTYNYDAMTRELESAGIGMGAWMDAFRGEGKNAADVYQNLAKDITKYLSEAGGNTEEAFQRLMGSIVKDGDKVWGLSEEQARQAIAIVKGEMDSFSGTAKNTAEVMQDNLKGQLTILKSALQELAIQISDALTPSIRNIVSKVQTFVEKLQQMDEGTRNSILKWGLFVAAIGPVLTIIGKLTSGFGMIFTGISKLGTGILTLVNQAQLGIGVGGQIASMLSALASGPVLALIAGIGLLVAAFVHLWNTNEEFRDKVKEIWENVKTAFKSFFDAISALLKALEPLFIAVLAVIKVIWEEFCNFLSPILEGAFTIIVAVLETAVGVLSGILKVFTGIFTLDWSTFWDGIKTIFESIWNGLSSILSAVLNTIKGVAEVYLKWFAAVWEAAWNAIKAVFEMIWNGIASFFSLIWEGLKAVVTTVSGAIASAISTAWEGVKAVFSTVWNAISDSLKAAWDAMKNIVEVALLAIASLIDAALKIITIPFAFIWENCKDIIKTAWDKIYNGVNETMTLIAGLIRKVWEGIKATISSILTPMADFVSKKWEWIKDAVSNAMEAARDKITAAWEAVKEKVSSIVDGVTSYIGDKWDAAKERLSSIVDGIKEYVSSKWEALKDSVSSTVENIGSYISTRWNAVKEYTSGIWDGIKNYVLGIWDAIKDGIATRIQGMWDSVKNMFTGMWQTISDIIQRIKDCFSFDWKLPKIKLPHFKITGSFSLAPPSVPSLSIEWYKKAMNDAYILNDPTIFGMSGGRLLGGGEAGQEAVVGTDKLGAIVREAVASVMGGGSTIIPVYIGQERIEEIVVRANQSINYRSGGR